jgi:tRNA(Met) cytidine acetyltransferase
MIVLTGSPEVTVDAAVQVLTAAQIPIEERTVVSNRQIASAKQLALTESSALLGTTWTGIVLDCHGETRPNAIGHAVGAVDGGGLLLLLTPPLDKWPDAPDKTAKSLAAPPFRKSQVTGRLRRRLAKTLCSHRGIAIYDATTETLERDGLTHPAPTLRTQLTDEEKRESYGNCFQAAAYDACLTTDQCEALNTLEALQTPNFVVLTANRGRGKSSAAGLAAGSLALMGERVLVTAPTAQNAQEVLARSAELLRSVDCLGQSVEQRVSSTNGGAVTFLEPTQAANKLTEYSAAIVDEAAALPVDTLTAFLTGPPAAFVTTVHGYEGTGRGFDVRFRDRLEETKRDVHDVTMAEPIRYAGGDPIEVWAFHALLLDARPPAEQLVADATPSTTAYSTLSPESLLTNENRFKQLFGLLVLAHYRTEPDDLARLLDAPNIAIRALLHEGHVVAVALVAREGGLSADRRRRMYEGRRVRGNMLPDLLTSQLRDEQAAKPIGVRVLRIATHHAVRSRGLGSKLIHAIASEMSAGGPWPGAVDYLGVGYGATPDLLRFWCANGFQSVHLSTTVNDRSGEHSALMIRPLTMAGQNLCNRSMAFLLSRFPSVLGDALRTADPDVVRGVLAGIDLPVTVELTEREWRVVASAAYGPGMYDADPRPFRRLAVKALVEDGEELGATSERLLVRKVLQAWEWDRAAEDLSYISKRAVMRALGDAYQPLVDQYGTAAAHVEADRYR